MIKYQRDKQKFFVYPAGVVWSFMALYSQTYISENLQIKHCGLVCVSQLQRVRKSSGILKFTICTII